MRMDIILARDRLQSESSFCAPCRERKKISSTGSLKNVLVKIDGVDRKGGERQRNHLHSVFVELGFRKEESSTYLFIVKIRPCTFLDTTYSPWGFRRGEAWWTKMMSVDQQFLYEKDLSSTYCHSASFYLPSTIVVHFWCCWWVGW